MAASKRRPLNRIVDLVDEITHEFAVLPFGVTDRLRQIREIALPADARKKLTREKSKPYTAGRKAKAKTARKSGAKRSGAKSGK